MALDEPVGDSDGTKGGKKIFDCDGNKFGAFVRPNELQMGDFPPVDDFDAELDEI